MPAITSHLRRRGLGACQGLALLWPLLGVAPGCPVEPFDPATDESSDDGSATDELEDSSEGDDGTSGDDDTTTNAAPGRSDAESGSEGGESSTPAEDGSTSSDEPPCVDAHFVVFVAPGGEPHVDVPAGLQVVRTFADDTMEAAECQLTGGRGECIMACIPSETHIDAIQFDWPCADGTTASVRVQSPEFVVEIEVAAAEATSGCA